MLRRVFSSLVGLALLAFAAPSGATGQLAPATPGRAPALPPVEPVDGPLALTVVYPKADAELTARDSEFVFGSTGSGRATLTIDGTPVDVAADGAFLAWLPLPDDTVAVFHLAASKGTGRAAERQTLDWRVRLPPRFVPPSDRLWLDPASLSPRGEVWAQPGEMLRVEARAAPGASVAVRLPDGRVFPLAPDTASAAAYGPFERQVARLASGPPALRFVGAVPAVPLGAPLPPIATPAPPPGAAPDARGAWAVAAVVATLEGASDTIVTPLPVRVTLLDPAVSAVVSLGDTATGAGPGAAAAGSGGRARPYVVGAPAPHGTFHWLFPPGTPAALDGRRGDQLRVRLSRESAAWVDLGNVAAVLPPGTPPPATRVRLVRLTPADSLVEARVSLDARVPFLVAEDERSVTLRLYGAASDLDFVQYGGTDPLVLRVTWAQPSEDECTVTFDLGAKVFGWRTRWDGRDLLLDLRRPPAVDPARPLAGRVIAVDPGHPPEGATGPTGLREADANLAVALALRGLLEREGARVVMTRTADTALELYDRTAVAERASAEALVSIHQNALPDGVNPFVNAGTSTYYYFPRAARLALLTQEALVGELGLRNLGAARGNFALVRVSWMPAILTEGAFLMIPEQESALRTPAFQEAYARGIALGLQAYFRDFASAAPPPPPPPGSGSGGGRNLP